MVSKKEYREREYLLIGLIIGAGLSFLGSFVAGSYFTFNPESNSYLFWASFIGFWAILIFGYFMILKLDKMSK